MSAPTAEELAALAARRERLLDQATLDNLRAVEVSDFVLAASLRQRARNCEALAAALQQRIQPQ